jgi:hypothetical protein
MPSWNSDNLRKVVKFVEVAKQSGMAWLGWRLDSLDSLHRAKEPFLDSWRIWAARLNNSQ